ncbi:MAG: ATP synthase F0 subunit B [Acidobacteria bacterium]|nr:ATP synthase F0 subunit B [Acidobacteriota bacterium]
MSLDLSVLWVIASVLLCVFLLNTLVFKPLLRVMHERESAIESARGLAERAAHEARAATDEFEAKTAAARAEVYRGLEASRQEGLAERGRLLEQTRVETEAAVAQAAESLRAETEAAKARLTAEAEQLGGEIAEKVLDRRVS